MKNGLLDLPNRVSFIFPTRKKYRNILPLSGALEIDSLHPFSVARPPRCSGGPRRCEGVNAAERMYDYVILSGSLVERIRKINYAYAM